MSVISLLVCLYVLCADYLKTPPQPVSLSTCLHHNWVESTNWRQSVPRLSSLEWGLDSESWLSSQEVLFLTTLHKHWKRDPWKKRKKIHPRLTISTVNTLTYKYNTALTSLLFSYVSGRSCLFLHSVADGELRKQVPDLADYLHLLLCYCSYLEEGY